MRLARTPSSAGRGYVKLTLSPNTFLLFRFKTRLMRLNSIEAKSRAKLNFLEQL